MAIGRWKPDGNGSGYYDASEPVDKVVQTEDLNPDHHPANGGFWLEERDDDSVVLVLQVKEHGAIMMRATADEGGHLQFAGLSTFTTEQICKDRL